MKNSRSKRGWEWIEADRQSFDLSLFTQHLKGDGKAEYLEDISLAYTLKNNFKMIFLQSMIFVLSGTKENMLYIYSLFKTTFNN